MSLTLCKAIVRMSIDKGKILKNICFTELVYGRINKKLNTQFSKTPIEDFVFRVLSETKERFFSKIGKNIYVINRENKVKITVNLNTYRIITVDRLVYQ